MANFDFEIPINFKDLQDSGGSASQYVVKSLVSPVQLQSKVDQFRVGLSRQGPAVIVDHFDTFYSVLEGWSRASPELITDSWTQINKALTKLTQALPEVLAGGGSHQQNSLRIHQNALKMICFVVCQLAEHLENKSTTPSLAAAAKAKKATKKQQQDEWPFHFDWEAEKQKLVVAFCQLMQLNLHRLWDPPVVEDSFLNMVTTTAFKFFENPNINRQKSIQTEVAVLVSICLVRYNQMSSICCRIMQILAHHESALAPLTQLIVTLVESHDLQSTVPAIVREICRIDPEDLIRDASGSKAYAKILQDLAKRIPDCFMSSIPILIPLLDLSDPYVMRSAVLSVIGEIYVQRLTKMNNADKKIVDLRDKFADFLEQHMHDVNGIVRGRVFQIWIHASENSAIMISRFHNLLDLAIGQVMDKTMLVRKYAIELIVSMLRNNPFNSQFEADVLEEKFKAEEDKLDQMKEEAKKKDGKGEEEEEEEGEDDKEKDWEKMEKVIVEELDKEEEEEEEKQSQETNGEVGVKEEESLESVLLRICEFVAKEKVKSAIVLFKAACVSFPTHPVLNPESAVKPNKHIRNILLNMDSEEEDEEQRMETDKEGQDEDAPLSLREKTLRGLKSLFIAHRQGVEEIKKLAAQNAKKGEEEEMNMSETDIAIKKQEILVLYLKDSYNFTLLLQRCIPTVCGLLGSPSSTDVTQAVSFFVNAHNFGIRQAIVGIRKMLALIYSSNAAIKEAVTGAYRDLYLSPPGNPRQKAMAISRNLIQLADGATRKETMCLECVVREWVKSKEIDDNVVKVLWEYFTGKLPDAKPTDAKWAVRLLTMAGSENTGILKANVDVLVQVGFAADVEDLELSVFTAEAIARLPTTAPATDKKSKPSSSSDNLPSKFPNDDKMLTAMTELLVSRFADASTPFWMPLMEKVTFALYSLAENPDLVCGELLQKIATVAKNNCTPEDCEGMVASTPMKTKSPGKESFDGTNLDESVMSTIPSQTMPSKISISVFLLKRLIALAGHVALRQLDHLDRNVAKELKRIRALQEEKKETQSKEKKEKKKKSEEEEAEEEMGLQGASADDQEAEFIARLCEREIVSPPNLLSCFFKFIIYVCQNPNTFHDESLQTTAITALAKYMIVSQSLCQDNLQLLFTILERSTFEMVRSNAIIVLTDMAKRFPNLIEPWTPHLYARLRDSSITVRNMTVAVLTHLILHDMVKVKGQISEMAICLIDDNQTNSTQTIADSAAHFFAELANKGNALYNILPDIISRLSDPEKGVGAEPFREIMKKIMKYISKDRQKEQVVEKLCQRFRSCKTDQQWRDLAFCISQLNFNDKMIQKLQENFASFGDKLADEDIYESFQLIVSNSKKFSKQAFKTLLEEFEAAIDKAHSKGVGDEGNEAGKEGAEAAASTQGRTSKKPKPKASRGPNKTKKKKKEWDSGSEQEEEESESEEEQVENVPIKSQKNTKKAPVPSKSRSKVPELDSDSDDDEFVKEAETKTKANSKPGGRAPPPPDSSDEDDDEEKPPPVRARGGKGSVCAAKSKTSASASSSSSRSRKR